MISSVAVRSWLLASCFALSACPTGARAGEDDPKQDQGSKEGQEPKKDSTTSTSRADEPPFEQLLEFNTAQIFGGKAKVSGDRLEVVFSADGEMAAGFEGKGIIDSKSIEMRGVNRNFIVLEKKDNVETLLPGLAAVGMGDGVWTTRFPVAGTPWVQLGMRVPNLIGPQSSMKVRVNWDKGAGYETHFFNNVSYISGGLAKGTQTTAIKEYQPPAYKWFPRKDKKSGLKIGFGFKNDKCLVEIGSKEVAAVPKPSDRGGRVSFVFSKLTFTLDNVKIQGKLDRKWAEQQLDALRKSGKLKLKADPPPDGAPPGSSQ